MSQRGVAESTQWAVLLPAMMALVLGLVQAGVWLSARTVAAQAAAAVADLRAAQAGTDQAADQAGHRIAAAGGLRNVQIAVTANAGQVLVTVSGQAPVFFDLGQSLVIEQAVLPREQVTR